jgi:tRNA nucleotidyltransferase (CCA-adding enzyme)
LAPGPQIGDLLEAIQLAQAEGLVNGREDALAWVKQQLT